MNRKEIPVITTFHILDCNLPVTQIRISLSELTNFLTIIPLNLRCILTKIEPNKDDGSAVFTFSCGKNEYFEHFKAA